MLQTIIVKMGEQLDVHGLVDAPVVRNMDGSVGGFIGGFIGWLVSW